MPNDTIVIKITTVHNLKGTHCCSFLKQLERDGKSSMTTSQLCHVLSVTSLECGGIEPGDIPPMSA
jgi:hypothetical protein